LVDPIVVERLCTLRTGFPNYLAEPAYPADRSSPAVMFRAAQALTISTYFELTSRRYRLHMTSPSPIRRSTFHEYRRQAALHVRDYKTQRARFSFKTFM
jgi:hypothetical protein